MTDSLVILVKVFQLSLSKDEGLQNCSLVVHILQLERPDGLRLYYFKIDICALQPIENVLELTGKV